MHQNDRMSPDRRAAPREPLELPITLDDGCPAVTRNISTRGVYLTTSPDVQLDRWVFIEYESRETGLRFAAAGEVLRIEPGPQQLGVAVRLHSPQVIPLQ